MLVTSFREVMPIAKLELSVWVMMHVSLPDLFLMTNDVIIDVTQISSCIDKTGTKSSIQQPWCNSISRSSSSVH